MQPGLDLTGRTLAHYRCVERIGQGGMGTVYKALDTHLDRFVAIKTFRRDAAITPEQKRRFVQEAKTASALNHPNIIHIYDISECEDIDFIVMEYVEGTPLDRLLRQKLPVADTLRYAIQIADALRAAHGAGIVHRDLKPSNVVIAKHQLAKVLDFGLAKLIFRETPSESGTNTPTEQITATLEGIALGTPGYMSPEQAQGLPIDPRSDIFSFGIMLYEMVTGKLPFHGTNKLSILTSILRDEPPPPGSVSQGMPAALGAAIQRCLRKNPAERFQDMQQVKMALEAVAAGGGRPWLVLPRMPWKKIGAAAGAAVILAGAAWVWNAGKEPKPQPAGEPVLTRITSDSGLSTDPAISPDGKLLAYASDRAGQGNLDIWARQIAGGEAIRLTSDPADDHEPDFSPDGTKVVFRSERAGGGIYTVPTFGGDARLLAEGGRNPRFSPQGDRVAYWVGAVLPFGSNPGSSRTYIVNSNGGPAVQMHPEFAAACLPVWSPDGKHLLFMGRKGAERLPDPSWWIATPEGGAAAEVKIPTNGDSWYPYAWHGDFVYFTASHREYGNLRRIPIVANPWRVNGEARGLTVGTTREEAPSVAADGSVLFASVMGSPSIYSLRVDNKGARAGPVERLTQSAAPEVQPSMSQDGKRLAFVRRGADDKQLWAMDLETNVARQLSVTTAQPWLSADGTRVAYTSGAPTDRTTLLMPFEGGIARRLCGHCGDPAGWSPDGKTLLAADYLQNPTSIATLDVASGARLEYLKHPRYSLYPRGFSPDGRWMLFAENRSEGWLRILVAPYQPDKPPPESQWIEIPEARDGLPRWALAGNLMYFSSYRDGFRCVWAQVLNPHTRQPEGKPFAVAHFHEAGLQMAATETSFSVAKSRLVFGLERKNGNIWKWAPGK